MRRKRTLGLALLALVVLLGGCSQGASGSAAIAATPAHPVGGEGGPRVSEGVKLGPPEYRALWVDAFHEGIHSAQEIDRLVDTAHRANLNALFVQVRKNADAYYLDSLEPVAWDIYAPRTFDPLAYLIRRAHSQWPRIEVHAWVNTFFVNSRSAVYYYFGADWGNRTSLGRAGGYLDPGNPAVRNYTRRVLVHLAQRYDVDGLHLDFVRYPEGGDWGYSPAAVAAFDVSSGRTGSPDPGDPAWGQWRRDQVTAFVRDLSHDLVRPKPKVKLSAAVIAWGTGPASDADWQKTAAYSEVFQDWNAWLRDGILDLAVPMNYDMAWSPRTARWFDQWIGWEKDSQYQRRIIIGVGAFFNYPEDTLTQIRQALAPTALSGRAAGVSIYSYASTSLYGTDDYYDDAEAAMTLPRQPYAAGLDPPGLSQRARQFNGAFWKLLTTPGSYTDPVVGPIQTQPVFTEPASVPPLPGRR